MAAGEVWARRLFESKGCVVHRGPPPANNEPPGCFISGPVRAPALLADDVDPLTPKQWGLCGVITYMVQMS